VQEYYTGKAKYSLQREANLLKQKYMKEEEATQNINNQLKSRTENRKQKKSRMNQCMDNSTRTLKAHQWMNKNP
jgi:hypothetical protein